MSKRKFKVGDRVRVYGGIPNADDIILSGATGTVVEVWRVDADGDIKVRFEGLSSGSWNVFSQQCRRLKPRAKSVRTTKTKLAEARVSKQKDAMKKEYERGFKDGHKCCEFRADKLEKELNEVRQIIEKVNERFPVALSESLAALGYNMNEETVQ